MSDSEDEHVIMALIDRPANHFSGSDSTNSSDSLFSDSDEAEPRRKRAKIENYVEKTVKEYNNDEFKSHFRMSQKTTYEFIIDVVVDGKTIGVELCDTAGEDELNTLRQLCYPGTDVVMLCFSIVKPSTFLSACNRWADEITRLGAAVVLVGTQADLKNNREVLNELRLIGQRPVMSSEANGLAERLNAPYIETSAKACTHLKEAFDTAIVIALKRQKKSRRAWKKLVCCVR